MNQLQKLYSPQVFLIILLFFTILTVNAQADCNQQQLNDNSNKSQESQTAKYNDYYIKFENLGNQYKIFLISRNNKELFHDEFVTALISGDTLESIHNINNIKYPLLIVDSYSGGAHCCYTSTFINLHNDFPIITEVNGYHSPVNIEKLHGIPGYRIKLNDWHYAYRWTSFALSSAPEVILHYVGDKYLVAIEEMRKKNLTSQELDLLIQDINKNAYDKFKYPYDLENLSAEERKLTEAYFSKLFENSLDLIYSGRAPQAKTLIEKTWLGDEGSKKNFLNDLAKAIKESEYYDALVVLNTPFTLDFL